MSIVTTQLLAEIPPFSAMDEEERAELRFLMTERIFQPGEVVMKAAKDRLNADLDYQVNVKAEMEMNVMAKPIRAIESKLRHIHCDVLATKID